MLSPSFSQNGSRGIDYLEALSGFLQGGSKIYWRTSGMLWISHFLTLAGKGICSLFGGPLPCGNLEIRTRNVRKTLLKAKSQNKRAFMCKTSRSLFWRPNGFKIRKRTHRPKLNKSVRVVSSRYEKNHIKGKMYVFAGFDMDMTNRAILRTGRI